MTALNIDQALTNIVLNGGLAVDLVHENGTYSLWGGASYTHPKEVYEPNANSEFIELTNFPANIAMLSLNDSDDYTGVFQGIVKYPIDTGDFDAKTKADEFLSLFPFGSPISYNGQDVNVMSKSKDSGRTENGFYQIVCRVEYRAFVAR